MSMQQSALSVVIIPAQSPNSLSCQKPTPYKVRVVFSKPVHAVRAGGWPTWSQPWAYHSQA